MDFWLLASVVVAGMFAAAATLCLLAFAFYQSEYKRPTLAALAIVSMLCATASLWLAAGRTPGSTDPKVLAKEIADQIRSAPLKVEVTGGTSGAPANNGSAIADAIVEKLRAAPFDVQVTKAPPFDDAALAKAIADNIRPPGATGPLLDSKAVEGTGVLVLILSVLGTIAALVRQLVFKKGSMRETLIALAGVAIGLAAIFTSHYWPPPTDSSQVLVSIDSVGSGAGQEFFEASAKVPIRFDPGDDVPSPEAVCAALQELNTHGSAVAVVVGSHDRIPLTPAATLRFSSNAGLARRRAESVKAILAGNAQARPCASPPIKTVITLSNAPANADARRKSSDAFQKDRAAMIFGLGSH